MHGFARTGRRTLSPCAQQRQRAAFWFLAPMVVALFCVGGRCCADLVFVHRHVDGQPLWQQVDWVRQLPEELQTLTSNGTIHYKGTLADPAWWNAVWNTIRFAVSVILEISSA